MSRVVRTEVHFEGRISIAYSDEEKRDSVANAVGIPVDVNGDYVCYPSEVVYHLGKLDFRVNEYITQWLTVNAWGTNHIHFRELKALHALMLLSRTEKDVVIKIDDVEFNNNPLRPVHLKSSTPISSQNYINALELIQKCLIYAEKHRMQIYYSYVYIQEGDK